ncbi:MAG: tRNA (adenosine(37)-N6)-threonylcarbamoyltransferase complex ATPase subunit type 1 TsaE [Candidatus Vogelbacteria bacterium CG10_big_fil_rev_8_21_14_0_10_51_16]|uniref:tRNA threonylcarbamoyladenosine biosynthesis protein TsaE n=1 Tax=Candidatus Vogelbacteria bacterium CG10_big_fil_rev_8_21_14_0_10_51_16 TaxID=1975045 RepID=A0A2H0RDP1_9BACT|nr:MAG: tRNA (adenosine(37)-N6)-threonylcarbamoyltransferase complex ATPase subunit type 1 TsaE [Candidatus Vogelbacteria bacterium CG10_big_fil_rev_8_21_14_0_10_51_16]
MRKVVTKSLEETHAVAKEFLVWLNTTHKETTPVLALYGDLGAGKTAFVQGLAKAIGIKERITSPTFVLMKNYAICCGFDSSWSELVHIDAYRFETADDLKALNWEKVIMPADKIVALEWPERVATALPMDTTIPLYFRFIDETTREIELPDSVASSL